MEDRELLEAAARAAGLTAHRYCEAWKGMAEYTLQDGYFGPTWNPLTDDGDALRLAVKLGMGVIQWKDGVSATHAQTNREFPEPWGEDPYAATRRAIVRAAASLSQQEKTR